MFLDPVQPPPQSNTRWKLACTSLSRGIVYSIVRMANMEIQHTARLAS